MSIKRSTINHFFYVQNALDKINSDAYLNTKKFFLELHFSNKSVTLYPQFTSKTKYGKQYSDTCDQDSFVFFNGWRPYRPKTIPSFTDKLLFKKKIMKQGIKTPAYTHDQDDAFPDALIKNQVSSFSADIKGPFRDISACEINKDKGDYFEEFIFGEIVKIWYVENRPIVYEKIPMPFVVGDGVSTLEELVKNKVEDIKDRKLKDISDCMLSYYGKSLKDIPANGEKQVVDFKYVSVMRDIEDVSYDSIENLDLRKQLDQIGSVTWGMAKEEVKGMLIYTIDAILDKKEQLWILEANSNPIIHPCCYDAMIDILSKN